MLDAIAGAKRFISMETYIFQPDSIGVRFRDALTEAASRGVEVRVIFDSIGSLETDPAFWKPLVDAGAETVEFHPLASWRMHWPDTLNKRDHRKLLVVDGDQGFCGGINIHDEELPLEQDGGGWRDLHVRLLGPAVRELHLMFLDVWRYQEGREPPNLDELLPRVPPSGSLSVRAAGTNALKKRRTIHRAYRHAIRKATTFIYLWNPYFIPDRGVRRDLRNACKRGVDVKIIVPARGDIAAIQLASRYLYGRLMRVGVKIYEWREHVMHAKCGVIDGQWSTVGSFNLDHRSLLHNLELNLMVFGDDFGLRMVEEFDKDLDNCALVDRTSWKYRPLLDRLFERFFYLFRYWM